MTIDAVLLIIQKYTESSKPNEAEILNFVKADIEFQIQTENDLVNKRNGRCKLCGKESSRLVEGLYCSLCYDMFID